MLLELGPLPPDDVRSWVRFARRVICEVRLDPGDLDGVVTTDALDAWSGLLDSWDVHAVGVLDLDDDSPFRWSDEAVDPELAAFMLHAMDRIVRSDDVQERLTKSESRANTPFTMLVVKSFAEGLCAVGSCESHLVGQIISSLQDRLELPADVLSTT